MAEGVYSFRFRSTCFPISTGVPIELSQIIYIIEIARLLVPEVRAHLLRLKTRSVSFREARQNEDSYRSVFFVIHMSYKGTYTGSIPEVYKSMELHGKKMPKIKSPKRINQESIKTYQLLILIMVLHIDWLYRQT